MLAKNRLGKKREQAGAAGRPILVKLKNTVTVSDLMKKQKKLKETQKLKGCYLKPDLTQKQRDLKKKLVQELGVKEEQEGRKFRIKNWKVVPALERRPDGEAEA
jgi:hypothetical protein